MKKILRLLVLFAMLAVWSVSCGNIDVHKPVWWSSWLINSTCQLPCWRNITPGVTTIKEAISILENSPDVKISYRVNNSIEWDFTPNKNGGGIIRASQDGIINSIELGGDSEIMLQTIIESYGEPKYVKTYDCRNSMCAAFLIYPNLGMLVDVFVENTGKNDENLQVEILPEIVSYDVFFIEPGMENFKKITSFQDYGSPMEWKGYGEYP